MRIFHFLNSLRPSLAFSFLFSFSTLLPLSFVVFPSSSGQWMRRSSWWMIPSVGSSFFQSWSWLQRRLRMILHWKLSKCFHCALQTLKMASCPFSFVLQRNLCFLHPFLIKISKKLKKPQKIGLTSSFTFVSLAWLLTKLASLVSNALWMIWPPKSNAKSLHSESFEENILMTKSLGWNSFWTVFLGTQSHGNGGQSSGFQFVVQSHCLWKKLGDWRLRIWGSTGWCWLPSFSRRVPYWSDFFKWGGCSWVKLEELPNRNRAMKDFGPDLHIAKHSF